MLVWHRRDDSNWREELHSTNADGTANINGHDENGKIVGGFIAIPANTDDERKMNGRWWPR